ncbi:hypothetical protein HGP14_33660 [Rhizobium sp. P32RR-XVIII]|uniref:hypothetical protein n=1 Tax=Rhizobium sp. P32RR-XVIII TaxID=2726738 RepID=UPI00145685FC|nr:hypothetical protein [Rhizobium sp. P32RR-XVIII]NLS08144.1 hypothetical protein [Rhizobium sp. P32RR-XVIII]
MVRIYKLVLENQSAIVAVGLIVVALLVHFALDIAFGTILFVAAAVALLMGARVYDLDRDEEA